MRNQTSANGIVINNELQGNLRVQICNNPVANKHDQGTRMGHESAD